MPLLSLVYLSNGYFFFRPSDGSFWLKVTVKTDKKWHRKCIFHRLKMSTHILGDNLENLRQKSNYEYEKLHYLNLEKTTKYEDKKLVSRKKANIQNFTCIFSSNKCNIPTFTLVIWDIFSGSIFWAFYAHSSVLNQLRPLWLLCSYNIQLHLCGFLTALRSTI